MKIAKKWMAVLLLCFLIMGGWRETVRAEQGSITLHIETQPGAPNVLFPNEEELFAAILTNDDRQNAQDGHHIRVIISVSTTQSPWDANVIEKGKKDYALGRYLDISIHKRIGEREIQVARLNRPVTMRVQIPEDLRGYPDYALIRSHLGEGTLLPLLEKSDTELVVQSDQFSTYAILHRGEKRIPETNQELGIAILMGIGILAFLIGVLALWRKTKV